MIADFKDQIEKTLNSLIPTSSKFAPSLYAGAKHSLLAPGKRIRPLLTLCTAHLFEKEDVKRALYPACALEMVHTYSLIHDDLPCMDDDDFRRGLPTLHKVYTEGHAVLVGDYLLTYAFEVIANAPQLSDHQKVRLSQTLAVAGGGGGMIGGQVMDIEESSQVEELHARKTAALFRAAVEFGGITSNASTKQVADLRTFGMCYGKLFQMVDDILDGDHPLGEVKAQEAAHTLYQQTLEILENLPGDTTYLKELIHLVFAQCEKLPAT